MTVRDRHPGASAITSPSNRAAGNAAGACDLLIGLLLAAADSLGALYQLNESTASAHDGKSDALPKLLCPLH